MYFMKITSLITLLTCILSQQAISQSKQVLQDAEQAMLKATSFMVEKASTNGGYVWYYLSDLSRRWGEMEAYKTMIR